MALGVAMLASVFPPTVGGIQTHTRKLAEKLAERGLAVHVITRALPGTPREERLGGVHVHRVGAAWAGRRGTPAYVLGALQLLRQLSDRVSILHAHQLLSPSTIALFARVLFGKPIIVNPHAGGPIGDVAQLRRSLLGRARLAALRAWADSFVSISRAIAEELRGAGMPPERIEEIPNGVDTEQFLPASDPEKRARRLSLGLPEGPFAVYAGRLAHEKGVDVLLEAWAEVCRALPVARLLILGEGAERPQLESLARRLGLDGNLRFAGAVPDVAPVLRCADVAVLPSRTEGLPVALLEAMACAVPAVATAVGGSQQVLRDGETGRLVAPEDRGALARAIIEAFTSPRARVWAKAARVHVLRHHSIEEVADRFLSLYRRLVQPRESLTLSSQGGVP